MSVATHVFGILGSVIILLGIVEMLRRRQLSEKYAVLWLITGVGILILTIFPHLLRGLSDLLGIAVPTNLLFFVSIVFTIGVSLHQSWELSRLESETRKLAEDLAILRLDMEQQLKQRTTD